MVQRLCNLEVTWSKKKKTKLVSILENNNTILSFFILTNNIECLSVHISKQKKTKKTKTNAYLYFCVCCSYHLQALRHLAVLAAEPRLLVPVDVDSLKSCYALLEVTYKVRLQETCTNLIPVNDHWVHVSKLNIVFPVPKPPLKPPLILCHSSLSQTAPLCSVLHFYIHTKANVRSDSDCSAQWFLFVLRCQKNLPVHYTTVFCFFISVNCSQLVNFLTPYVLLVKHVTCKWRKVIALHLSFLQKWYPALCRFQFYIRESENSITPQQNLFLKSSRKKKLLVLRATHTSQVLKHSSNCFLCQQVHCQNFMYVTVAS